MPRQRFYIFEPAAWRYVAWTFVFLALLWLRTPAASDPQTPPPPKAPLPSSGPGPREPAMDEPTAREAAPDGSAWREDEYARMKRPETPAQAAKRQQTGKQEDIFDPAQYRIKQMFEKGLEEAPKAEEEKKPAPFLKTAGNFRIESQDYLDYDEAHNVINGRARTTIHFQDFLLIADKVRVDVTLKEAEAVGNVELRRGKDLIRATWLRYNFDLQQGDAKGVNGTMSDLHFEAPADEDPLHPAFRKVNPKMDLFSKASMTGCDFPVPHYRVRAKEFILYEQDRVFARNAVLYVWDIPVLWVPAYTRSLTEPGPWSVVLGYGSRVGAAFRVSYDYYYKDYVPATEAGGKKKYDEKAFSQTTLIYDYLTRRGQGVGLDEKYDFDYDKHKGEIKLYSINDRDFLTATKTDSNKSRYQAYWWHRTNVTPDLQFLLNIDWISDPDLYFDVLDFFSTSIDDERRISERRARAALTLVKEDWLARIMIDIKDRVGRDRITDFSEPTDDDADFNSNLDSKGRALTEKNRKKEIDIPGSRYGRVSQRLPQITVATQWLKPFAMPLYYQLDLNIFNNLDKGLNTLGKDDDAYVRGFDLYQSLMYAMNIGESSAWTNKIGVGFGAMTRSSNEIGSENTEDVITQDELRDNFAEFNQNPQAFIRRHHLTDPYEFSSVDLKRKGNISTFVDANGNIHYKADDQLLLEGYSTGFAYADYESKWTTRFNDALSGYIRYFIREGARNSLMEDYRMLGDRLAQSDLYDYRLRAHEIGAGGVYELARPDLRINLDAGHNLRSKGELAPGEYVDYVSLSTNYRSPEDVFQLSGGIGYDRTQQRPPDDPFQFVRDVASAFIGARYFPKGDRYWLGLDAVVQKQLNRDPLTGDSGGRTNDSGFNTQDSLAGFDNLNHRRRNAFRENLTDYQITPVAGARIGEKWRGQLGVTYDWQAGGLDRIGLILTRDLHDAELGLSFLAKSARSNGNNASNSGSLNNVSAKASLTFKLPGKEPAGGRKINTLQDTRRTQTASEQ